MQRFFLGVVVAAALAIFAALPTPPSHAATSSACGGDRWPVIAPNAIELHPILRFACLSG